jgi:hypothetical protein
LSFGRALAAADTRLGGNKPSRHSKSVPSSERLKTIIPMAGARLFLGALEQKEKYRAAQRKRDQSANKNPKCNALEKTF